MKLVVNGETLSKLLRAATVTAQSIYKKSEISLFHVDPGDCRSIKEWREIKDLNECISAISL